MDADQRLKILSEKLEGTVKQINEIDAKPSFAKRVGKHFRAQGSHITNIILAGVVLSVALGRLGQKQQFEVILLIFVTKISWPQASTRK